MTAWVHSVYGLVLGMCLQHLIQISRDGADARVHFVPKHPVQQLLLCLYVLVYLLDWFTTASTLQGTAIDGIAGRMGPAVGIATVVPIISLSVAALSTAESTGRGVIAFATYVFFATVVECFVGVMCALGTSSCQNRACPESATYLVIILLVYGVIRFLLAWAALSYGRTPRTNPAAMAIPLLFPVIAFMTKLLLLAMLSKGMANGYLTHLLHLTT